MRKVILPKVKAAFPLVAGILATAFLFPASAQQYVIANKDVTRPEQAATRSHIGNVGDFAVQSFNGYNEVSWSMTSPAQVRRVIVEYSTNSIDYQVAGENNSAGPEFAHKHYFSESSPMLYRLKFELAEGGYVYSRSMMLEGTMHSPVTVYPTMISGNVVNINASWPVQRVDIVAADGTIILAKSVNGLKDFIPVALPNLTKGMYWVAIYGDDWKVTNKIVVP